MRLFEFIQQLRPTKRLIVIAALWALIALVVSFFNQYQQWWLIMGSVCLVIAIMDMIGLARSKSPTIKRQVANNLALNVWTDVKLTITNPHHTACQLTLFDHHPANIQQQGLPANLSVPAKSHIHFTYKAKAKRRGNAAFHHTALLITSLFGCWQRHRLIPCAQPIKVYPNFAAVSGYALLATENRTSQMGIMKKQRRGEGSDFHQLRDYRQGDSLRHVDWKASSRLRKLIAREYQDERDQQVFFMLDCGHRMSAEDEQLNHFDHCLNATLLLSYIALRQGDSVGLMTLGGNHRYIPPRKGMHTINQLLNTIYDLEVSEQAADYTHAAKTVLQLQKRRSLIVLLTNFRDDDIDEVIPALHSLQRKHLVLVANLREPHIDTIAQQPIQKLNDALSYCGNESYMNQRQHLHDHLTQLGVMTLDVTAQQLPIAVVNRYLDIKTAGIL